MSGTTTGIIVICVVVVAALVSWLLLVRRAADHQAQEHSQAEPGRKLVQGGQHVGGGRSVAPTRDAPVPQGGGEAPSAEEEDAGVAATKEAAHELHSGSQSAQRPEDPAEWSEEPVDRSEQPAQQAGRPNSPMDL
jgi:hypothetical protein